MESTDMKNTSISSTTASPSMESLSDGITEVLNSMMGLIMPVMVITVLLWMLPRIFHIIQLSDNRRPEPGKSEPKLESPGKMLEKMMDEIDGEFVPNWVYDLIKLEEKGKTDKGVTEELKKLEDSFRLQMKSYQENLSTFKKLDNHVMSNGIRISPHSSTVEDLRLLAESLSNQKTNLLQKGDELLSLHLQTSKKAHAKAAEELKLKMEKELEAQKEMEIQRELERQKELEAALEKERTVEENVLTTILSSEESTDEMKHRAEQLLPHFKGKTEAEQLREMKQQDFELDLLTLEGIVKGKTVVVEMEKLIN